MASISSRSAIIALIVSCAMFMENLDSTVISTAIPAIAQSFAVAPVDLSLGITAYMLGLAIFIPISGYVADRFGGRKTFCTAIAIFTGASICCALCTTLPEFALARILQGLGGAMMVPVGRLVLLRSVSKAELVDAFAYVTLPTIFAPILGAPIGGFITTYLSWQWIFLVNVPIGALGIVLARIFIPDIRDAIRRPLDWIGFILTSAAISALVFGLELAARRHADPALVSALLVTGVAAGIAAIRHSGRVAHPLVDFSLLRIPTYSASVLGGAAYRVACGALPLVLPLILQVGLGMTAFASGLLTLSGAIGGFVMKQTAARVLRAFGFRRVLIVNGILSAASMALCVCISKALAVWLIVALLLAGGFFRSLQFTALMAIAWADIPPKRASAATSLFGLLQQVSFSGGIAFGAILLNVSLIWYGQDRLTAPGDFQIAFFGIGGLALVNVLSFARLRHSAGAEVSGHAARRLADESA